MAQWDKKDQHDSAPKFVVDAATGQTGQDQYGNTVFGVDGREAAAAGATVPHSGWVRRTVGTGGRAGRVQEEVLVALNAQAFKNAAGEYEDATDFANTDAQASANDTIATADDTVYPDA